MSRYADKPPFFDGAAYVAVRGFTLNGKEYTPGEAVVTDGVEPRVLRNLYNQNRIAMQAFTEPPKPKRRAQEQAAQASPATTPAETPSAATAPAPAASGEAPKYRIKQAGLGGWKVIDASGAPVGKGHKTKEEAQAEIDRLMAQ